MHKKVEYLCKCIILRLISYLILLSFYICTIYLYNTFMGCTINEIADALSLSRNTVSKVINGKGGVSPKTAEMIVKKAKELGYGQIGEPPRRVQATEGGTILLLTRNKAYSGFWMEVMEGIRESMIARRNFSKEICSRVEGLEKSRLNDAKRSTTYKWT